MCTRRCASPCRRSHCTAPVVEGEWQAAAAEGSRRESFEAPLVVPLCELLLEPLCASFERGWRPCGWSSDEVEARSLQEQPVRIIDNGRACGNSPLQLQVEVSIALQGGQQRGVQHVVQREVGHVVQRGVHWSPSGALPHVL